MLTYTQKKQAMNTTKKEQIYIVYSKRRKSISISVYPNKVIKINAPQHTSNFQIQQVLKLKQQWINQKINYFSNLKTQNIVKKKYIKGEKLYYLGKPYSIKIIESKKNNIIISDENLKIFIKPKTNIKNLIFKWLKNEAHKIFNERLKINFEIFSQKYKYQKPNLVIRKMKARWGSIINNKKITLNTFLIHCTIECIDYVIMHELCHLKYLNHKREFYDLQSHFIPNYKVLNDVLKKMHFEILSM